MAQAGQQEQHDGSLVALDVAPIRGGGADGEHRAHCLLMLGGFLAALAASLLAVLAHRLEQLLQRLNALGPRRERQHHIALAATQHPSMHYAS